MDKINSAQRDFVSMLTLSEEHARHGFELLSKRDDAVEFFAEVQKRGLLRAVNNPKPIETVKPGTFQIAYWPALTYLKALALRSRETNDDELANNIIEVVRDVSNLSDDSQLDNYHTNRVFAEILALLPSMSTSAADFELFEKWFSGKFDTSLVAVEVIKHVVPSLLNQADSVSNEKLRVVTRHFARKYLPAITSDGEASESDKYWFVEFVRAHASAIGARLGEVAFDIFHDCLLELLKSRDLGEFHWLHRPAIESHEQNKKYPGLQDAYIDALRDVLVAWAATDINAAARISTLIDSQHELLGRIAIHVVDENFDRFGTIYNKDSIGKFISRYKLHETYRLLKRHFASFDDALKLDTLRFILAIPNPSAGDDQEGRGNWTRRNWLSSITNQGFQPADEALVAFNLISGIGPLPDHPDFHSYSFSSWGFGSTPYSSEELLGFLESEELVQLLNSFEESDTWRGPSIRSLVDTLKETVAREPRSFFPVLREFLGAKRPYQYAVVAGLKNAWAALEPLQRKSWEDFWTISIAFCNQIVREQAYWEEPVEDPSWSTPNRSWVSSGIVELIEAGVRDDDSMLDRSTIDVVQHLLDIVITNSISAEPLSDDPVLAAINSLHGKAIEAQINVVLRECRTSDALLNNHDGVWENFKGTFDKELALCKNANFHCSTILSMYLANLLYVDQDWVERNILEVFPSEFEESFKAAAAGLAYVPSNARVYKLLNEKGIISKALGMDLLGREARERLIERVVLAYLWNIESISGERFSAVLSDVEDIGTVLSFLNGIGRKEIDADIAAKVMVLYLRVFDCLPTSHERYESLMSAISMSVRVIDPTNREHIELLVNTAPYVNYSHNGFTFVEELAELSDTAPRESYEIFASMLTKFVPSYDYNDSIIRLLQNLIHADMKLEVQDLASRLSHLDEVYSLFKTMVS